jgi:hypothetical protein
MNRWLWTVVLALAPVAAQAAVGVGARVGGYGFREVEDGEATWQGCRMNGFGLFGTYDLDRDRELFAEGGLDFYQATDDAVRDERMDRLSLHAQVALGVRFFPDFIVSPHVQAGLGAEWTKLEVVGTTLRRDALLGTGFLGLGAELNASQRLHLGSNLRMLAMAGPDLAHRKAGDDLPLAYRAAGQAQFYVRYDL